MSPPERSTCCQLPPSEPTSPRKRSLTCSSPLREPLPCRLQPTGLQPEQSRVTRLVSVKATMGSGKHGYVYSPKAHALFSWGPPQPGPARTRMADVRVSPAGTSTLHDVSKPFCWEHKVKSPDSTETNSTLGGSRS